MTSRWEDLWPDVFSGHDTTIRRSVAAALSDATLAGVEPIRDDAVDLIAVATGEIPESEYRRRTLARLAGGNPPSGV